jgi:hypothetical protein
VRVFVVLPVKATPLVPPDTECSPKFMLTLELLTRLDGVESPPEVAPEMVCEPKATLCPKLSAELMPRVFRLKFDATARKGRRRGECSVVQISKAMPRTIQDHVGVVVVARGEIHKPQCTKNFSPAGYSQS